LTRLFAPIFAGLHQIGDEGASKRNGTIDDLLDPISTGERPKIDSDKYAALNENGRLRPQGRTVYDPS
jgi:hypothetical protein